jgi:hypothetical protein
LVLIHGLSGNRRLYLPYGQAYPEKQTRLLELWDDLNIAHKKKKQEFGSTLTIIGFEVDPNAMTVTMPQKALLDLIAFLESFLESSTHGKRLELREFQRLAGWVNWALNVFPHLKPGLSNCYSKMAGKDNPKAQVYVNKRMREDLMWLINHLRSASGVRVYKSLFWDVTLSDLEIYCDASQDGLAFYIPSIRTAFRSDLPCEPPTEHIFFFEALAVCSALHETTRLPSIPSKLTIHTDNSNTVNIYNSLRATHIYNVILKSSVDILLGHSIDLQVLHIPGELNLVADAVSRSLFTLAKSLVPGLIIKPFQPPQDVLGAVQK